jgi:hypothetical protein
MTHKSVRYSEPEFISVHSLLKVPKHVTNIFTHLLRFFLGFQYSCAISSLLNPNAERYANFFGIHGETIPVS